MNFFQRRRLRKIKKHLLHEARHAKNMREDIADPRDLSEMKNAVAAVTEAWGRGEADALERSFDRLAECISRVYPQEPFARGREYVEILTVALAVAMGFRTFFVQPFKIPTGSMQPTLYGITVVPKSSPGLGDRFPLNILKVAALGRRYVEVRANASGQVDPFYQYDREADAFVVYIDRIPHAVHRGMERHFELGQHVAKGQLLGSGERIYGDHIFVDKVRYNFTRPRRGDVVVFDTTGIEHPQIRVNSFYIKRLAGLPNETVQIVPPYLVVNGSPVTQPYPFERLLNAPAYGHRGYQLARADPSASEPLLSSPGDNITLQDDQILVLGDNTAHSLDGRYFGPIRRPRLVGPAFAVYWPLSLRWGPLR